MICPEDNKLVLLGVGQVAYHVACLASGYRLIGTTRNKDKIQSLQANGITSFLIENDFTFQQQIDLTNILTNAYVLVSFPPDEDSDKFFSSLCSESKRIIYISSTSVYGQYHGIVDETTQTDWQNTRSKLRLEAEKYWLEKGAIILRAPGLYGPASGLHLRLSNGTYRLPQKSDNYISRIHLQDLARIILAAFAKPLPISSTYLVGDIEPASQLEVVQWLCKKMKLPLPKEAELNNTPVSLTANRRVNAKKILDELDIKLQFPTYKEGYSDCLAKAGIINFCDPV
jgi:hypothetical protein